MPTVQTTYLGDLRTQSAHLQSGSELITDAPTDNQGKGEAFSPTDLVATALGTCLLTTIAIFARRDGIELAGSSAEVTKVMSTEAPRRIARLEATITMKTQEPISDEQKAKLEKIGHRCPVSLSLHPDVVQDIRYSW
jgi:putative redox protein